MFGNTITQKHLTKDNVLFELNIKGYNEIDLCFHYISGFKTLNKAIKSDLRTNDKNNSMHISTTSSGNIIISDFGLVTGLNIFSYIALKYFNDNTNFKNILKAYEKVRQDFDLVNIRPYNGEIKNKKSKIKPVKLNLIQNKKLEVDIYTKKRSWLKSDEKYWSLFGISIAKLEEKKIYPTSKCRIINDNTKTDTIIHFKNNPVYVYPEYYSKTHYKLYLPFGLNGNADFKWISNIPKNIIPNFKNIPKSGKNLIIQSSYKDLMCMEMLGDYNILPLNGEGMWFTEAAWEYLKSNWENIIYFGDNDFNKLDNPGLNFCKKYKSNYGVDYITTPNNTTSDISDYYKKYGEKATKKLLNNLL